MMNESHGTILDRTRLFTLLLVGLASFGLLLGSTGCPLDITPPEPELMPEPDPDAPTPIFGGDAALIRGNVEGAEFSFVATDMLPSEGGALESAVLEAEVPNVLTAQVLHASAIGQGLKAESEASIANLQMTVLGNDISMSFLTSTAMAECVNGDPVVDGDFQIAELVLNGESMSVTTEENQIFTIINESDEEVGQIIVNEQVSTVEGTMGEFVVNALRLEIFGQAEIEVGHARASIECPVEEKPLAPQPIGDFVTGGGFIETEGFAANFGVAGGIMDGELFGHLVYIDHGTDLKVKGTGVTGYDVVDATTRRIEGTCEVNQIGGFTYEVIVEDNGEPGVNDTFSINVSNGYSANGTLVGGNIQLHEEVVAAE